MKDVNKQFAEEALKNIVTNLIKIYKKMFLVSKEWEDQTLILALLDRFYELSSRVLKFRNTEIYQSLIKQVKEILYQKDVESLKLKEFYGFLETITEIYFV